MGHSSTNTQNLATRLVLLSFAWILVLSKNLFIFTIQKNKNLWEEHLNLEKKENSKDGI